jgi:hypothetical protein
MPTTATLQDILLTPETQPQVMTDGYALIQHQVSDMSGISGTAIKVAYKTVTTFASGHVQYMIEQLLPGMIIQLEPFWADYNAAGEGEFGDYLAARGDEVSQALLTVTDERAKQSDRPTIIKAYGAVRGSAAKHVQAALPQVGALVVKYA